MMRCLLPVFALALFLSPLARAQEPADAVELSTPDPYGIWSTLRRVDDLLQDPATATWPRKPAAPKSDSPAEALRAPQFAAADPGVRARALETHLGGEERAALTTALDALADPDAGVRAVALRILRERDPARVTVAVVDRLAQGETWELEALYNALPDLRTTLAAPMRAFFQDERETSLYRQAAALALGRLGGDGAGDALAAVVWEDDVPLAEAAVQALYLLHETDRTGAWSDLLLHPSTEIRNTAMNALGEQGDAQALENLAMVARGDIGLEPAMELLAVDMMARWPLRDAAAPLIEAMKRNLNVRRRVRDHLRFRTGLDLADVPSDWEFALFGPPPASPDNTRGPITEDAPSQLLQEVNFVPPPMRGGVQIEYPEQ